MGASNKTQGQQWLFAIEHEIQSDTGPKIKVLRRVDREPAEKVLKSRAKNVSEGKAPIAEPAMYRCEMKPTLLPKEAAEDLQCSVAQIYNLVDSGSLHAFSINNDPKPKKRHLRIVSASVAKLINARKQS